MCIIGDGTITINPIFGRDYIGDTGFATNVDDITGIGNAWFTYTTDPAHYVDAGSSGAAPCGSDTCVTRYTTFGIAWSADAGPADPPQGTVGMEVVLTGSSFGGKQGKVKLGTKKCKVTPGTWSATSLKILMSKPLSPTTYSIIVYPKEPKKTPPITFPNAFNIVGPRLAEGTWSGDEGQSIAIDGNYFGMPKKGKIYFSYLDNGIAKKKACKVTGWTMNSTTSASTATFTAPKLVSGTYDLILSNKVGTVTRVGGLTIP